MFATNDLGVKVWETTYLPFGGVHTTTGGIDLRFPGQWFQSESGLHQNWMRDYDPTTGRYVQADPLGLVDGASVYGYAGQSPLRFVDPVGLEIYVGIDQSAASGYGHISGGTDPDNMKGFYPKADNPTAEGCGVSCNYSGPGEVRIDERSDLDQIIRFESTAEADMKFQNCLDSRETDPGDYHLLRRSCLDMVRDCLRDAGIPVPRGNRPDSVYDRLKRLSTDRWLRPARNPPFTVISNE